VAAAACIDGWTADRQQHWQIKCFVFEQQQHLSMSINCLPLCVCPPLQAGYHQQQPLSDQEWQLLPVLMAGRLMQSTLIGTYTISRVGLMPATCSCANQLHAASVTIFICQNCGAAGHRATHSAGQLQHTSTMGFSRGQFLFELDYLASPQQRAEAA
jgi:hypothetical protein